MQSLVFCLKFHQNHQIQDNKINTIVSKHIIQNNTVDQKAGGKVFSACFLAGRRSKGTKKEQKRIQTVACSHSGFLLLSVGFQEDSRAKNPADAGFFAPDVCAGAQTSPDVNEKSSSRISR